MQSSMPYWGNGRFDPPVVDPPTLPGDLTIFVFCGMPLLPVEALRAALVASLGRTFDRAWAVFEVEVERAFGFGLEDFTASSPLVCK